MACKNITIKSKEEILQNGGSVVASVKNQDFKSWFGQSKVVDSEGNPLLVFHGTNSKIHFEEFKPNINKKEQLGFGIHFAENFDFANDCYATDKKNGRVYPVFLKIENMLDADQICYEGSPEFALAKKLLGKKLYTQKNEAGIPGCYLQNVLDRVPPQRTAQVIQDFGYDGIKYTAMYGSGINYIQHTINIERKESSYIVFSPEQIRIATN
jgi:hypothetical protein